MTRPVIAALGVARRQLFIGIVVALAACGAGSDSVSGPGSADSASADFSRSTRARIISTVSVTSTASTVNFGSTLQLAAAALNSFGGTIFGNPIVWASSDTTVLTVSSTGLATAVRPGTAAIKATIAGINGSDSITVLAVTPSAVTTLAVTAVNDTSATLTFTEVGNGAGGAASADIRYAPAPIQWGSATSVTRGTCATPVAATAVGSTLTCTVLGLTPGTAYNFELVTFRGTLNLNAVFGKQSNVVAGTTTVPVVASVAVTPSTATLNIGAKMSLAATVKDNNNNVMTGKPVAWTSSNTAIATIDSTGTITGVAAGAATFTATVAGISGTASVTVAALPPSSVSNLALAAINDTSATLTFTQVSNGAGGAASADIRYAPAPIQWGSATSVTRGTCATPVAGTAVGGTLTCTVLGLTPGTAYNFELVTFRGTLNVNAVFGNQSNIVAGTTTAPVVASVAVTPSTATLNIGAKASLAATVKDNNNNVMTGKPVAWTSSNTAIATIDSTGTIAGVSAGAVTFTATVAGISGTASVTVTALPPGTVSNLTVAGINDTTATLTFTEVSDGAGGAAAVDVRFAPAPLQWGSATSVTRGTCTTPVAGTTVGTTLNCTVLGLTPGTAYNFAVVAFRGTLNVNAVFGGESNVAAGTTTSPAIGSVTVAPATATSNVGAKLALVATVKDKNNNVVTGKPVAWASSNTAVATVDSTGMTTGMAPGAVTFTATVAGVSGMAAVTEMPVVGSVTVTPATATSNVGATLALAATVRDQSNNVLTGKTVTWTSSNTAIATVDATGLTTGIAPGTVTFTASVAGVSGTSTVTETAVVQGPVQYPNQPAGLTRFAEINFAALPAAAGLTGTLAGNFYTAQSPATHITLVSDPTAPVPSSSVLQMDFEKGTIAGNETATGYRLFGGWDGISSLSNTEYSEYYESTEFKIPTPDFETQEVGVKLLGYWGVGKNNQAIATGQGPIQLYSVIRGSGTGTSIMSSWNLDMYTQGVTTTALPQNMNLSTKVTAGTWHQFETYMKLNTIGQNNGVWKWWLDGVLIGDYENVQFINSSQPSGFFGRYMNLVWGGQGGTPKTRTDYVWFNHMYMSGVFLRAANPCGC